MVLSAHFTGQNSPFGCVYAGCDGKALFPDGFFRYSGQTVSYGWSVMTV
jgi:hypothetical protein